MNKRQKIVQQQFINNEEGIIKRLKQVYGESQKHLEGVAQKLQDDIDALDARIAQTDDEEEKKVLRSQVQSKVYQKKYQGSLKKQVDDILDNMQATEFKTVSSYLDKCYEDGFVGTMYDLHGQGIPMCFPLDQKAMVRAVQLDSKISKGLYTRLGEDVALLKKKITAQVSRGISTGMSFEQIARQLSRDTKIGFNNAIRIARTEGHRIQVQSTMDACYNAKEKGADVVKQWDSTLDAKTRESHVAVDGEIRELDKEFSNGLMFPGDPDGGAAEVINCRCALLQRAKWALQGGFTKMNNFTKQLESFDSPESYSDFKKGFFSKENKQYMNYVEQMENKYRTKDFASVLDKMDVREYKHYSKLLGGNPLFDKDVLTNNDKSDIMQSKNKAFKKIKGTHNIEDDIGTKETPVCNPRFKSGGVEYKNNCGYCSATYEMRRRGFDVIANPKNTLSVGDWLNLFESSSYMEVSPQKDEKYLDTLSKKILNQTSEGSRGSLFVKWKGKRVGHFFSWEVENGKVRFVDGQNGKTDASEYFDLIRPQETLCVRWDNLKPNNKKIKEACKNRGGD